MPPDRSRRLPRFIGPAIITLAALCMLFWSWGTWPDPLVDFGTHLYIPWQLSTGKVLYRDITYYNGPLSPYFNSLMFRLFGVSIRTLVLVNLLILAATMLLAFRLTLRASGRATAIFGALTFVLIFAFGQIVLIGNYNWVTPYAHELTHGTALGLLAIACIHRSQHKQQIACIITAGLATGAALLTKAEPAAAILPAAACQLLAQRWGGRAVLKSLTKIAPIFIAAFFTPPLLAWCLLATAMRPALALQGVLGSWPWVFDRRVTSLAFYQNITGLNDVAGNFSTMAQWTAAYAILLGAAAFLGLFATSRPRLIATSAFILVFIPLLWEFHAINWTGMLTPLPILLLLCLGLKTISIIRRQADSNHLALQTALIVFSLVLLAKMGLKPHAYHYGFVLIWPATIVLVSVVVHDLPQWIARRGGSGAVVRAAGLAAWIVAILAILNRDAQNFDAKQYTVAPATPDAFRATTCGLEVQQLCDQIRQLTPQNGTVAVFPQGLMINYLSRRANPIPNVNFMPPEVLAAGEQTFINALQQHPPDLIIITSTVIQDNHFSLDGKDLYGQKMLSWITKNYQPVEVINLQPPLPTIYRFVVSKRRAN
jgi:hypothetical protein